MNQCLIIGMYGYTKDTVNMYVCMLETFECMYVCICMCVPSVEALQHVLLRVNAGHSEVGRRKVAVEAVVVTIVRKHLYTCMHVCILL